MESCWMTWSDKSLVLQGTFELYSEKYFSLAEWIVVAGAAIGAFAVCVPNLHHLRIYSSISCVLVIIFALITIAISCHDGEADHQDLQHAHACCKHHCYLMP